MTPLSASTLDTNSPAANPPGRPVGLTVWLIWLLFLNAVAALVLPAVGAAYNSLGPPSPASSAMLFAPTILAVINIACVIALFKNRKWGFWGLCATAVAFIPVIGKLGGGAVGGAIAGGFGVIGNGILYALLSAGDKNQKAWPRLK